jgi:hypothetical protein
VPVEIQDLAQEYQSKADEDLLRLALDAADLTPEAHVVLNNELSRRGINNSELIAFQEEEEQRKEEDRKEGKLFVLHPYGIGRDRFGKADRVYDPTSRIERFKTTVFVVLIWFPLIPTGTFLVEKKRSLFSKQVKILRRLPLDWEQILQVWVVATSVLLSIIVAFRVLPYFLR